LFGGCPELVAQQQYENRSKGGRPKGTTNAAIRKKKKQTDEATEAACKEYKQAKDTAKSEDRTCDDGTLLSIVKAQELKHELEAGTLNIPAIIKRVQRKNVSGVSQSRTSPLAEIEPILVQYCIRLAKIGQPLTKDQLTGLAISMISGTTIEEKVKDWKKKFSQFNDEQELVSDAWYQGFLNRNKLVLNRVRARMKDINRVEWVTYANFEQMYESVYQKMIDAKVAVRLPEPVWFNRKGEIVDNEEDSFGLKSDIHITHPEWIVFVDETGVNTNQKDDGHVGNHYWLDEDHRDEVQVRDTATKKQEMERGAKRALTAVAADERLQKAEAAFRAGENLTIDHLKALIKSRKRPADSPLKSARSALELQWSRRLMREQIPAQTLFQRDPSEDVRELSTI
jgi:hypothetical protein